MALFDPVFYRKAYSDLARCRQCDLRSHYAVCGQMENRLPNIHTFKTLYPLFDLAVYQTIPLNSSSSRLRSTMLISIIMDLTRIAILHSQMHTT